MTGGRLARGGGREGEGRGGTEVPRSDRGGAAELARARLFQGGRLQFWADATAGTQPAFPVGQLGDSYGLSRAGRRGRATWVCRRPQRSLRGEREAGTEEQGARKNFGRAVKEDGGSGRVFG